MHRRVTRAAGILLVALLGVSGIGAAASPQAAGAASPTAPLRPTIAVTAQPYGFTIHGSGRDHFVTLGLTLHITGSSFVPGSTVRMALISASNLKVLARFQTYSEAATVATRCPWGDNVCNVANPLAGTVDTTVRLDGSHAVSNLQLLYRAPHVTGLHEVAVQ